MLRAIIHWGVKFVADRLEHIPFQLFFGIVVGILAAAGLATEKTFTSFGH